MCLAIFLASCGPIPESKKRLGTFTVISSFDVRNLEYERNKNSVLTQGKVCYRMNPETGAYISGTNNDMLERAIDQAIRNAQEKGIDGDMLFNVRIDDVVEYRDVLVLGFLPVQKAYRCVVVEGDLVRVRPNSK